MEDETPLEQLKAELLSLANPDKAKQLQGFFKTGKGEYAEGDKMLGITVPKQRNLIKNYFHLSIDEIEELLHGAFHEERLCALLIMVHQFKKGNLDRQKSLFDLYLKNTRYINNWDLVDSSAEYIVGPWLEHKNKAILIDLAHSDSIWERRIAILSTFCYIKAGKAEWTLNIAKILLNDNEDLIQKAVGWMLREVGKRCSMIEEINFLEQHYKTMPRTMLRYAIERFDEIERQRWLHK
ncbi:MAG TPA: DNA alkylation repair protein [Ignavibacteriaceae bacterium]